MYDIAALIDSPEANKRLATVKQHLDGVDQAAQRVEAGEKQPESIEAEYMLLLQSLRAFISTGNSFVASVLEEPPSAPS